MIKRLNYTGRQRINQADVDAVLLEGPLRCVPAVRLEGYQLPPNGKVVFEAYRQTTWMRFDCGTVANLKAPASCELTEFESAEGILFRVRVTSAGNPAGAILAEADRVPPGRGDDEERREPLLPIKPEDLVDEVFRLEYVSGAPILKVSNRYGESRGVVRHPAFIALVLPQVLRDVLTRILLIDKHFDIEDDEMWQSRWLQFASRMPGVSALPREEDRELTEDWIDAAVAGFARVRRVGSLFEEYWRAGAHT